MIPDISSSFNFNGNHWVVSRGKPITYSNPNLDCRIDYKKSFAPHSPPHILTIRVLLMTTEQENYPIIYPVKSGFLLFEIVLVRFSTGSTSSTLVEYAQVTNRLDNRTPNSYSRVYFKLLSIGELSSKWISLDCLFVSIVNGYR